MKILLCYYLPFIIVTAKVIIIFKIKHKRKKKSKINKCIYENRSYYASEVISKIPNRTPRPMPMGSCPRHKQKTERPKDQETNDVLLRNKWITYGILTNRRPRDQKTKRQWITYGILINIRPRDQKTERPV